jgi:hypothetical protein
VTSASGVRQRRWKLRYRVDAPARHSEGRFVNEVGQPTRSASSVITVTHLLTATAKACEYASELMTEGS